MSEIAKIIEETLDEWFAGGLNNEEYMKRASSDLFTALSDKVVSREEYEKLQQENQMLKLTIENLSKPTLTKYE